MTKSELNLKIQESDFGTELFEVVHSIVNYVVFEYEADSMDVVEELERCIQEVKDKLS